MVKNCTFLLLFICLIKTFSGEKGYAGEEMQQKLKSFNIGTPWIDKYPGYELLLHKILLYEVILLV